MHPFIIKKKDEDRKFIVLDSAKLDDDETHYLITEIDTGELKHISAINLREDYSFVELFFI